MMMKRTMKRIIMKLKATISNNRNTIAIVIRMYCPGVTCLEKSFVVVCTERFFKI